MTKAYVIDYVASVCTLLCSVSSSSRALKCSKCEIRLCHKILDPSIGARETQTDARIGAAKYSCNRLASLERSGLVISVFDEDMALHMQMDL